MSLYTDFLKQRSTERVVLIELLSASSGTHRIANRTYKTEPTDNPANVLYRSRVIDQVRLEWRMGSAFGARGTVANGGTIVVAKDKSTEDWVFQTWISATIRYGHPSWPIAEFGVPMSVNIESVEADRTTIRFELGDLYEPLRAPLQNVIEWAFNNFGRLRPLAYGHPKNCTPFSRDQSGVPIWFVHESDECEDVLVTGYVNQKSAGGWWKSTFGFGLFDSPNGAVTVDVKGAKDTEGANNWLQKAGESLLHALTRGSEQYSGYAAGGGSNYIILDERASDIDDAYVGFDVFHWSVANNSTDIVGVCTDYIAAERKVVISGSWTYVPVDGDGFLIDGDTGGSPVTSLVQAGPMTPAGIDTASFTALDSVWTDQVGIWVNKNESALAVLEMVLGPYGYHHFHENKLAVGLITDPAAAAADLEVGDILIRGDIKVELQQRKAWSLDIGVDKNHTVANIGVAGGVNAARLNYINQEYRYVPHRDRQILDDDPDAIEFTVDTVFTQRSAGESEITRIWPLVSKDRFYYEMPAFTEPLAYPLGSVFNVTHDDHDLQTGKKLVMVGLEAELIQGHTEVELWG